MKEVKVCTGGGRLIFENIFRLCREAILNRAVKGRRLEYRARDILERASYLVIRSAGSHGPFDLVALSPLGVRLIQVKANHAGEAEIESLRMFSTHPSNASKELWLFRDGQSEPIVKVL